MFFLLLVFSHPTVLQAEARIILLEYKFNITGDLSTVYRQRNSSL
jgi:gamma-glutamylcysteine synthetase